MKKFAFIIGIISLAVACNAIEEPSNLVDEKAQEVKQVANAPVLSASIDESAEAQTKSYLNEADWRILWTANDEISAFVNTTSNWEYKFAGATGDQNGSFNPVNSPSGGSALTNVYAVYPYNASNSIDANGVMTVEFPASQTYKAKSFGQGANTMVAVSSTSADNLSFKSACGYLMLKLYGNSDVKVKSISFKGRNNEKIAGAATISIPLGGDPTVTMASNATDEIVLTCTSAVAIGNSSSNFTEFWLAIPPVQLNNGFTITVTTDDGRVFTKSNKNSFTVIRSRGMKMSPIEVKVPTNLSYVETANTYIVDVNNINDLGYCFDCTVAGNGVTVDMAAFGFATHDNCWPKVNGTYSSSLPAAHPTDIRVVLNQNSCISDVRYENGKIYFKASASRSKGNAQILMMDAADDNPAWVWHIWCTDQPGVVRFTNVSSWGYTYDIMDRNLGALTNGVDETNIDNMCGLYYQFGNPTGFTYSEFSSASVNSKGWRMVDGIAGAAKTRKPYLDIAGDWRWFNCYGSNDAQNIFGILWGGGSASVSQSSPHYLKRGPSAKKTMYDPCPAGYKVMPIDFIISDSDSGNQWGWYKNGTNGSIFFPYNGAAWEGDFWMHRGYVPNGDTANYTTLWTSANQGNSMAYSFHIYSKDINRAGGGTIGNDQPIARGMGVRCVADVQ